MEWPNDQAPLQLRQTGRIYLQTVCEPASIFRQWFYKEVMRTDKSNWFGESERYESSWTILIDLITYWSMPAARANL
jgi:hypothetical protein